MIEDITPVPQSQPPAGVEILSMEEIAGLEQKVRENKAAELRGDPLPHIVTPEMLRAAVMGIRRMRGTMEMAAAAGGKKASKAAASIAIDLDGMGL